MWIARGLALVVCVLSAADDAGAVSARAACRAACEARNVPASCRWLGSPPRRCLQHAHRACRTALRETGAATCPLPPDLPACTTNHGCPFGALCADATCQVVPCTTPDGGPNCSGHQACHGAHCIVADCGGVTANCPAGLHCQPGDGPLGAISGECIADDPGITYCAVDTDCIEPFKPNQVCARGTCVPRRRPRRPGRRTTTSSTTVTTTTTTTSTTVLPACADVFDCPITVDVACCNQQCVPDPYAGMGICSTIFTAECTLCTTDDDCACNGIFCDSCEGTASLSGCVDPCSSG
jgi:hypothetical protein